MTPKQAMIFLIHVTDYLVAVFHENPKDETPLVAAKLVTIAFDRIPKF